MGAPFSSILSQKAGKFEGTSPKLADPAPEEAWVKGAARGADLEADASEEGLSEIAMDEVEASEDPLDPLNRALAAGFEWQNWAASMSPIAEAPSEPIAAAARVSLEQVLDQLVRKIAWSGDARAGTMRVELGAGSLAGAILLVQAEGKEVRVTLETPPGSDIAAWQERIERRLSKRGLRVVEFEVR